MDDDMAVSHRPPVAWTSSHRGPIGRNSWFLSLIPNSSVFDGFHLSLSRLCTFRESPRCCCLTTAAWPSTRRTWWKCCIFDRMAYPQMVVKISCLSIFSTNYIHTNPAHHFRSVSWFSIFVWTKSNVLCVMWSSLVDMRVASCTHTHTHTHTHTLQYTTTTQCSF